MTTTVYIDVLFLSNLIINMILLYGCAFCVNRKTSFLRSFLGASFGALYLCVMFFAKLSILESVVFKLLVSVTMIFLSFSYSYKKTHEFFKTLGIFYILNFVLAGGIMFANTSLNVGIIANGSIYFNTTLFSMLIGIGVVVLFGGGFSYIVKKSILNREMECELVLFHDGITITLKVFLDTGNSLFEPVSNTPVMVVSPNIAEKFAIVYAAGIPPNIKNFRIIPCKTVAGEGDVLYGFKPDKLIHNGKEINAAVAVSKEDFDNGYDAIINPLTLI